MRLLSILLLLLSTSTIAYPSGFFGGGGGGGGGTPGGADTQVQFNNAGAFAGDAGLTYNSGTDTLSIGSTTAIDTDSIDFTGVGSLNAGDDATQGLGLTLSGGDTSGGANDGGPVTVTTGTSLGGDPGRYTLNAHDILLNLDSGGSSNDWIMKAGTSTFGQAIIFQSTNASNESVLGVENATGLENRGVVHRSWVLKTDGSNQQLLDVGWDTARVSWGMIPFANGAGNKRPITLATQQSGGSYNDKQIFLEIAGDVVFGTNVIRAEDDATQGESLTVSAGDTSGGANDGGILNLTGGTSAGGTAGIVDIGSVTSHSNLAVNDISALEIDDGTNENYLFSIDSSTANDILIISGQTADTSSVVAIRGVTNDGTDDVALRIMTEGVNANGNTSNLFIGKIVALDATNHIIRSSRGNSGALRALVIQVEGNTNQIKLNTAGTVEIGAAQDVIFNGLVRPSASVVRDLGTSTRRWRNIFMGTTIQFQNANSSIGTSTNTNQIQMQTDGDVAMATGNLDLTGGELFVDGVQVVSNRITGWAAATGTATRTTFATTTVTTEQLAERVKALIDDLTTHGLIGS